jgi:hypothetical protein
MNQSPFARCIHALSFLVLAIGLVVSAIEGTAQNSNRVLELDGRESAWGQPLKQ